MFNHQIPFGWTQQRVRWKTTEASTQQWPVGQDHVPLTLFGLQYTSHSDRISCHLETICCLNAFEFLVSMFVICCTKSGKHFVIKIETLKTSEAVVWLLDLWSDLKRGNLNL